MAFIIGNEFTSFNAATLINQGNQVCLTGSNLPLIPGVTFSGVDTNQSTNLNGWPTILRNNIPTVVNGNVLTLYGTGINQILMGWDETSDSGTGKHSSMYIRNKSSVSTAAWSPWYEVLDSGNFIKYIATADGEGATGTWGINITGNANTAEFLLPITPDGTYERATYNVANGQRVIWSEAFGDNSLKYTANGEQHEYTDTGDFVLFLSPNPSTDSLPLNMYINGTYYGYFSGDLSGTATRARQAAISSVTNTLTYFDDSLGHFNFTSYIKYLVPPSNAVATESGVNGLPGNSNGLIINSDHTYYNQNDVISGRNGILQYGDAGPQLRFTVESEYTSGVILFNTHPETGGTWPSFHFLGQTTSNNTVTPAGITIKSAGIVAQSYMTIGSELLNINYTLVVNGQSGFYNNINMLDSIIHFTNNKQYIEWYDSAENRSEIREDESGLRWNGLGTYSVDNKIILNISNIEGINITTKDSITLLHNGNIIPSTASANLGNNITPIYLLNGILQACAYDLSATINAGAANRMAYYNNAHLIDDAAHFVNNSQLAINSTEAPSNNETLYVNGATRIVGHLTLGDTNDRFIYYKGTVVETPALMFIDNNSTEAEGNGLLLGAGGLTVIGAGTTSSLSSNILGITDLSAASKQLFLLSDTVINIESNASTFTDRIGIQITTNGNIIPIQSEAVNTNAQTLGTTDARWAKLYIGTADSYGSEAQPIYWNAGVPAPLTFIANRVQFSSTVNTLSGGTNTNGHYASDTKIAINSISEPAETLYVNGNTKIAGHLNPNATASYTLGVGGTNPLRWNGLYIGTADSYGSSEQPIYWNNGVPAATSYTLKATINNGTASRLAYYSGDRAISSSSITTDASYLGNVSYLSINNAHQTSYRLYVNGASYLGGNVTLLPTEETGTGGQLIWSGSTDGAKIYYQVNTADTGGLILEVSDDGDEFIQFAHSKQAMSIYVRPNSAQIYPYVTNKGSLGIGGNSPLRWGQVYVGTADSYGDAYTPVYWNNGVPAAITMIQQADFTIASGATSVTITKNNIYTDSTMVLAIVVTSGESNLNGPISWSSNTNIVTLSTTKTSGAVSGYILTARGAKI